MCNKGVVILEDAPTHSYIDLTTKCTCTKPRYHDLHIFSKGNGIQPGDPLRGWGAVRDLPVKNE